MPPLAACTLGRGVLTEVSVARAGMEATAILHITAGQVEQADTALFPASRLGQTIFRLQAAQVRRVAVGQQALRARAERRATREHPVWRRLTIFPASVPVGPAQRLAASGGVGGQGRAEET